MAQSKDYLMEAHHSGMAKLMDIVVKNMDKTNLSEEDLIAIRESKVSEYKPKNAIAICISKLDHKFQNKYQEPEKDVADVRAEYELNKHAKNSDGTNKYPELFEPTVEIKGKRSGSATYQMDPVSMTPIKDKPLVYNGDIKYETLKSFLVSSPFTNLRDLYKSINNTMDQAQKIGMRREQYVDWLLCFVEEEMPSHKGEIEYFQSTFERFKAITSLINYGEHMTKLFQQCEKIARKPGTDISQTMRLVYLFHFEKHQLAHPTAKDEESKRYAHRASKRLLKNFISKPMNKELKTFRYQQWKDFDRDTTYEQEVAFVGEMETKPKFRITETKYIKDKGQMVSVYNTQSMAYCEDESELESEVYSEYTDIDSEDDAECYLTSADVEAMKRKETLKRKRDGPRGSRRSSLPRRERLRRSERYQSQSSLNASDTDASVERARKRENKDRSRKSKVDTRAGEDHTGDKRPSRPSSVSSNNSRVSSRMSKRRSKKDEPVKTTKRCPKCMQKHRGVSKGECPVYGMEPAGSQKCKLCQGRHAGKCRTHKVERNGEESKGSRGIMKNRRSEKRDQSAASASEVEDLEMLLGN